MSCRPMLLEDPVSVTMTGGIFSAEKDNVQAVAAGAVDRVSVDRSDTYIDGFTVTTGTPVTSRASKQAAQSFFLNPVLSKGRALPKALDTESGNTTELNGLSFTRDNNHELNELEQATYSAVINDLAKNQDLSEAVTISKIGAAIDPAGLTGMIENALAERSRSAGISGLLSEEAEEAPTQEEIDALTAEVQAALNAYSPTIVQQVFPVAEDNHSIALLSIQNTLNNPNPEQTDAVAAAMDKTIAEYDKNGKGSASGNLSQYATMVSTREGFLSWATDFSTGRGESGDLLWIYAGDITHLAITGHAAVYNRFNRLWLTADSHVKVNDAATAITDYFDSDSQIIRQNLNKNMKLLRVNSAKTFEERRSMIEAKYNQYYGRAWGVPYFKSSDGGKLYCSQVCYLVWKSLGKDIDGTWLPTSFLLQSIAAISIPISIKVGWWTVTIVVVIFILIITLFTLDIIYPWDIVIDEDTVELLRFDE